MSIEYFIVAEGEFKEDLVVFDRLYKGKRTMLAMAPSQDINTVIEDYMNFWGEGLTKDSDLLLDCGLLLHLIHFLYKHPGYSFKIMKDWDLIEYLGEKYGEDWSWDSLTYYKPRF